MELIWEGVTEAISLLLQGDPEVVGIAILSLELSGLATLVALLLGVPLGAFLAFRVFRGRGFFVSLVNTGMGLPPVVVGLFVSITFWRSGPLGFLELLYTPGAIVLAQFVIAFPVVTGLTMAALQQIDPKLILQLKGLGASRLQLLSVLLWETRLPMLAAVIAGFGAVISEVGAVMMVGGNILGHTRVLTTATVLETRKGNFEVAIALSLILLGLTFLITWLLTHFQQRSAAK
ncbi:MAG: ABC transporter permease [Myxococcota bacterium]|nr:ABC transporter permease [Myxococcota bacterium]